MQISGLSKSELFANFSCGLQRAGTGILLYFSAIAKHNLEVVAPINAVIRDTVFIRDTVQVVQQKVEK